MTPYEMAAYILIAIVGMILGVAHYNKCLNSEPNQFASTYVINMIVSIAGVMLTAWAVYHLVAP